MASKKNKPTDNTANIEKTNISKAIEINIVDGKVQVVSALNPTSIIQVLSLAMFETSKVLSK